MSSDPSSDETRADLMAGLETYGRWLDARSDVGLRAPEPDSLVDHVDGAHVDGDGRNPRSIVAIAAAVAVAALGTIGLVALTGNGGADNIVTASSVEAAGDRGADDSRADRSGDQGDADGRNGEGRDADDNAPTSDGDGVARDDSDEPETDGAVATTVTTIVETAPSETIVCVTTPCETAPTRPVPETMPPISRPTTSAPIEEKPIEPPVSDRMFVSPLSGQSLDMKSSHTFQVHEIPNAVAYRFVGTQGGNTIIDTTMSGPMLIMPSPFITSDRAWPVEPGRFTMWVAAVDADGQALVEGEVTVTIQSMTGPDMTTRPPITLG